MYHWLHVFAWLTPRRCPLHDYIFFIFSVKKLIEQMIVVSRCLDWNGLRPVVGVKAVVELCCTLFRDFDTWWITIFFYTQTLSKPCRRSFADNVLAERREQCEKNGKETPDGNANGSKANDKELDDHVAMRGAAKHGMGLVEHTGVVG